MTTTMHATATKPAPTKGPAAVRAGSQPAFHTKSPFCTIRCCSAPANRGRQITAICACRGARRQDR
jgi:hypothetical protein